MVTETNERYDNMDEQGRRCAAPAQQILWFRYTLGFFSLIAGLIIGFSTATLPSNQKDWELCESKSVNPESFAWDKGFSILFDVYAFLSTMMLTGLLVAAAWFYDKKTARWQDQVRNTGFSIALLNIARGGCALWLDNRDWAKAPAIAWQLFFMIFSSLSVGLLSANVQAGFRERSRQSSTAAVRCLPSVPRSWSSFAGLLAVLPLMPSMYGQWHWDMVAQDNKHGFQWPFELFALGFTGLNLYLAYLAMNFSHQLAKVQPIAFTQCLLKSLKLLPLTLPMVYYLGAATQMMMQTQWHAPKPVAISGRVLMSAVSAVTIAGLFRHVVTGAKQTARAQQQLSQQALLV